MSDTNEQMFENMTLVEVDAKIEQLNRVRAKILHRERGKKVAIEQIKVQMQLHGITIDDLKIFESTNAKEKRAKPEVYDLHDLPLLGFSLKGSDGRHILIPNTNLLQAHYVDTVVAQQFASHGFLCSSFLCTLIDVVHSRRDISLNVPPNLLRPFIDVIGSRLLTAPLHQINNYNSPPPTDFFAVTQLDWKRD